MRNNMLGSVSLLLCTAFLMLFGSGAKTPRQEASAEDAPVWRLSTVNTFIDGSARESYQLQYDASETYPSRVSRVSYSGNGSLSTYSYDGDGRVVENKEYWSFGWEETAYPDWVTNYEYDADGNVLKEIGVGYETVYTYENGKIVSSHTDGYAYEGLDEYYTQNEVYSYDKRGLLSSVEENYIAETVRYDSRNEYFYDAGGTLIEEKYYTDGALQVDRTYTYDGYFRFSAEDQVNSSPYTYIQRLDPAGHILYSIFISGTPELIYDGDRLMRAVSSGDSVEFIYEQIGGGQREPAGSDWKKAYLDYIAADWRQMNYSEHEMATYDLMYVSDDDIPELWINYGYTAAGGMFCYYDGQQVVADQTSYYLEYAERGNVVCFIGGHMGQYYESYARFENGAFVDIGHGGYGGEYGQPLEGDTGDIPANTYYWNGTEMSREDYFAQRDRLLPPDKLRAPQYAYDYDGIVNFLLTKEDPADTRGSSATFSGYYTEQLGSMSLELSSLINFDSEHQWCIFYLNTWEDWIITEGPYSVGADGIIECKTERAIDCFEGTVTEYTDKTDQPVTHYSVTGDKLTILEKVSGYGSEFYYAGGGFSVAPESGMGTVTGDDVRVRSGPGTDYTVFTALDSGTRVSVIGSSSGWYRIECIDESGSVFRGFMRSDYIARD